MTAIPVVLIVEDDPPMAQMLSKILELEGFQALVAGSAEDALSILLFETPDVALLDVMLPGMNGFELCRRIRLFSEMPVIMLTAKDHEADKVEGLTVGADQYVTKPFSSRELVARMRAVLRRASQSATD